jgi:hypothetical protein
MVDMGVERRMRGKEEGVPERSEGNAAEATD